MGVSRLTGQKQTSSMGKGKRDAVWCENKAGQRKYNFWVFREYFFLPPVGFCRFLYAWVHT